MKYFNYFGYASNLDESTLEGRLQVKPEKVCVGVLPHYGFRFCHPNTDGSARANIVKSNNESVYGVLYKISENDRSYFLNSEPGYDFIEKDIYIKDGKIQAFTFISTENRIGIFPTAAYWGGILKGGKMNNLPETYLSQIINRAGKLF